MKIVSYLVVVSMVTISFAFTVVSIVSAFGKVPPFWIGPLIGFISGISFAFLWREE